jgi:hypothetical protein
MGDRDDRTAGFLIVHQDGTARTVVGIGTAPLAPLAARLAAEGKRGHLAVVHAGTGQLVIRCPLDRAEDEATRSASA